MATGCVPVASGPAVVHIRTMNALPPRLVTALADRYRIERELGAGGMATVYLAHDLKHDRKVAIKVLRQELAATLGPGRFTREIEIAAQLTHPNILPLHDSGDVDGVLYYVMPYIEGESLRDRLDAEGALPVDAAVRIFREIVDALGAAHRRGIVHRDVKPGNVLLTGGHALVSDFGVAKALREAGGTRKATTLGVALGTPLYMSPEQASADPGVDHRSDLFAAGVIAYEMLTGATPFEAATTPAILAAIMTREPQNPGLVREEVPTRLGELVLHCMAKDPADRPQSAAEVLALLDAAVAPSPAGEQGGGRGVAGGGFWTSARLAVAGVVLVAAALGGWWALDRGSEVRWARQEALPEVLRLADEGREGEAAELAFRVEEILGADPVLEPVWPRVTSPLRVVTDPAGASVSYRPYAEDEAAWIPLGSTPLETDRFPAGVYRLRVELDGHEPVEVGRSFIPESWLEVLRSAGFDYLGDPTYGIDLELTPVGTGPEGMIRVKGGTLLTVPIAGFGNVDPVDLPGFWLDRTEVTNEDYAEFVDAGAYTDSTLWTEPFRRDGQSVSWSDAQASFRDETGRPGPATWVLGRFPQGREDHPVGGVSWYEAAAYCAWQGKSLPTIFHWARAAVPSADSWAPFHPTLAGASNMRSDGPEPVGTRNAVGATGAQDLAGNVREWVYTASGEDRHFAGGAWNDPDYALVDQILASPWTRLPTEGFRCARFDGGAPPEHLLRSIELPAQDLSGFAPTPDAVFQSTARLYEYDRRQPLNARVDSTLPPVDGASVQWVSVDLPYGERLPMRLHIPSEAEPPYGAVIFFPGSDLFFSPAMGPPQLPFLARAGWILVEPVFEGGYQRNDGRTLQRLRSPAEQAVLYSHWAQDLGRAIDYLEQRGDVDPQAVAYAGLSLGASVSPRLLPYEPRLAAAILMSGGFSPRSPQAALDEQGGLAGRVRVPLLMLGGQHDFANPVTHQEALLRAFGTPEDQKRFHVYEAAHWPLPMTQVIRETVDFLERYAAPSGSR